MNLDLEDQLVEIFHVVFPLLPKDRIKLVQRSEFSDWDSLKQIEIVTEIEEGFGVMIDDASIMTILDFESTVNLVKSLL
jgi:acyl carrier protein